jgi:hypothetical protein
MRDRTVTIPINDIGMMAINFIGGPYTFPHTKMVELAEQANMKEKTLNTEDYQEQDFAHCDVLCDGLCDHPGYAPLAI